MTNLEFFKNGVHLSFLTDDNGLIRQSSLGAKKLIIRTLFLSRPRFSPRARILLRITVPNTREAC